MTIMRYITRVIYCKEVHHGCRLQERRTTRSAMLNAPGLRRHSHRRSLPAVQGKDGIRHK